MTFVNYAGPMGWTYWKDTCNQLTPCLVSIWPTSTN